MEHYLDEHQSLYYTVDQPHKYFQMRYKTSYFDFDYTTQCRNDILELH
jgi:hypothetical protein